MSTPPSDFPLPSLEAWLAPYGPFEPDETLAVAPEIAAGVLAELAGRLSSDNYPFGHPVYAGQMLKPPHPVAMAAYAMAMRVNPNNHALDGGPATAAMEREVVADLMRMIGYDPATSLGHLTSSGTIANLEALWVARELADEGRAEGGANGGTRPPGRAVAGSASAHYTHARMCQVLGVPFVPIATGPHGRMDLAALDAALAAGVGPDRIGTVVATAGTTSLGAVDPVDAIVARCRAMGVRVHLDAAYGGFFRLLADVGPADTNPTGGATRDCDGIVSDPRGDGGGGDPADGHPVGGRPAAMDTEGHRRLPTEVSRAFRAMGDCDSIVIDPHKHGLQSYGCGAVLFRNASVGRFYAHDSPYTYFTSDELHLGEISLECSRAGASAAALWATLRCLPLKADAGLGPILAKTRSAALAWAGLIAAHPRMRLVTPPDLDIVCWYPLPADGPAPATGGRWVSAISVETRRVFAAGMRPAQEPSAFFLATLTMTPGELTAPEHANLIWDEDRMTVVRSVLMKPEHAAFVGELHRRVTAVLG